MPLIEKVLDKFFKLDTLEFYQIEKILNNFIIEKRKLDKGNVVRFLIKKEANNFILEFQLYYKENPLNENVTKISEIYKFKSVIDIPKWYFEKIDKGEQVKITVDNADTLKKVEEKILTKINFDELENLFKKYEVEVLQKEKVKNYEKIISFHNNIFYITVRLAIVTKEQNKIYKDLIFSNISNIPTDLYKIIENNNEATIKL